MLTPDDLQVWANIASEAPDLDSRPLLKLREFANKLRRDERRLIRLVIEADLTWGAWEEDRFTPIRYDTGEIARAAGISEQHAAEIIAAGLGNINDPRLPRTAKRTVLEDLRRLSASTAHHEERLREWARQAHEQGWTDDQIAATINRPATTVAELHNHWVDP